VAHRLAHVRADLGRAKPVSVDVQADVLPALAALEPHRPVARAARVAQALERHAAAVAEAHRRLRAVLEDRDDLAAGRPQLLVAAAELNQVLAAEGAAEVAHESDHEGLPGPALGQPHRSFERLQADVWKA